MFGDTTRKGSYETTTGANIAAYTGGQVSRAKNLRKSNISLGKSDGAFETTAQRSFASLTADQVNNAQVSVASATQIRTEIATRKQKVAMVSSSHAATSDVNALYNVKYQKHGGADLRHTNFSLGKEKQNFASEAGATFQKHGATVYTAPVQKQKVSCNEAFVVMFGIRCHRCVCLI